MDSLYSGTGHSAALSPRSWELGGGAWLDPCENDTAAVGSGLDRPLNGFTIVYLTSE